ncbi:MAG: DUF86 domain-containing protein [Chloroflexota bacterium]|jgi:uncharacterized protein with HEPN domain
MNDHDLVRLRHMRDAAQASLSFAAGRNRDDLESDQQLVFALIKAVEIIGEAASRITQETQSAHPEIPWPQVIGMRNILVHAYFDVDYDRLWETVQRDLPELLKQLGTILSPDED